MAQGEFKHITVTPAEEADEVIHAGVERDAGADDIASAPPEAGIDAVSAAPPDLASTSSADKPPKPSKPSDCARAASKRAYEEPTLDDLRGDPMPLAQKIVIIAAVVCIIGALVCYFAFMR